MKRAVACILLLIYSCFTAGAATQILFAEGSFSVSMRDFYGYNVAAAEKDHAETSSHIKVVNAHKLYNHLAASRTFKISGISFAAVSSLVYTFATIAGSSNKANIAIINGRSRADLFIKNRVLRI